jgi:hypothetical protein
MYKLFLCTLVVVAGLLPQTFAKASSGGELYALPKSSTAVVGTPLEVRVFASANGEAVNAIEGELAYNPSDFVVEKISLEQSILSTWATAPSYDGSTGLIKFSGWAERPYSGNDGLLLTITLRPLRVGQSSLDFNSGAMLSVSGRGSNIITSMRSSVFRLEPKQIQPALVPAPVAPARSQPASSTPQFAPELPPSQSPAVVSSSSATPTSSPESNAAALALSGFELAPLFIPFFLLLVLVAFGIAYVLHRTHR